MPDYFPLCHRNQPHLIRDLVNPSLHPVKPDQLEGVAAKASSVLNVPGRVIQIGRQIIDLGLHGAEGNVASGAPLIEKLASHIGGGSDFPAVEIAALLCTEEFWAMESTSLAKSTFATSCYQLGEPATNAVNLEYENGRLLVHKTAWWHTAKSGEQVVHMSDGAALLSTDVVLSFDLRREGSIPGTAAWQRQALCASLEVACVKSPCADLQAVLLQCRSSFIEGLLRFLRFCLNTPGYWVRAGELGDEQRLSQTRPCLQPGEGGNRSGNLMEPAAPPSVGLRSSLFYQDTVVVASPSRRKVALLCADAHHMEQAARKTLQRLQATPTASLPTGREGLWPGPSLSGCPAGPRVKRQGNEAKAGQLGVEASPEYPQAPEKNSQAPVQIVDALPPVDRLLASRNEELEELKELEKLEEELEKLEEELNQQRYECDVLEQNNRELAERVQQLTKEKEALLAARQPDAVSEVRRAELDDVFWDRLSLHLDAPLREFLLTLMPLTTGEKGSALPKDEGLSKWMSSRGDERFADVVGGLAKQALAAWQVRTADVGEVATAPTSSDAAGDVDWSPGNGKD